MDSQVRLDGAGWLGVVRGLFHARDEQIRVLYESLFLGSAAVLFVNLSLYFMLGDVVPAERLWGWIGASSFVAIWRGVLAVGFRRKRRQAPDTAFWFRWYFITIVLLAAVIGSAPWVVYPQGEPQLQLMLIVIIIGMAAGGIITLNAHLASSASYVCIVLVPLAYRFVIDDDYPVVFGVLTLTFAGLCVHAARSFSASMLRSIGLLEERALFLERQIEDGKKLQENEQRFTELVENSVQGIIIHQEGKVVFANTAAAQMHGYARDQFIGLDTDALIDPADRERILEFRRSGQGGGVEFRALRADGSNIWLSGTAKTIPWEGRTARLNTFVDITERKLTEIALRKSDERYETAIEGANVTLWDWDFSTGRMFVSPQIADVIGEYSNDGYYEADWWLNRIHPDDLAAHKRAMGAHIKGESDHYEGTYRLMRSDGSYRWLASRGVALRNESGRAYRMAGSATDITERRRLESLLDEAVESLSEGFALYDENDRLVLMNRRYRELYKEHEQSLRLGRTFKEMLEEGVASGQFVDAVGREEEWVAERVEAHRNPAGTLEQHLPDGKCLRVTETRTPSGYIAGLRVDITNEKSAVEEAQASEARFRVVAETISQPVLIVSLSSGKILFANEAAARNHGVSPQEMTGRIGATNWADPSQWREFLDRLSKEDRVEGFEMRYCRPVDGKTRWVLLSAAKITYEGQPAFLVSHVDVTARREMEDALRQSEEDFRQLAEGSIQGILIVGRGRKPIFCNARCAEIFGYEGRREILALLSTEPLISSHDQPRLKEIRRKTLGAGKSKPIQYAFDGVRKDGSTVQIEAIAGSVNWRGETAGYVTLLDVSERNQAKQELERFFSISNDMFCVIGADGFFKQLNSAWQKHLGYSEAELLATPVVELIHPDDSPDIADGGTSWLGSFPSATFENRCRASDGGWRWLQWNAERFAGSDQVYATARDVTEQKLAEEQLRRSQKMEAVGQLTGGVAHDFNNLLTAVVGNLDLIRSRVSDDDVLCKRVDTALRGASRGAELTKQLLAFSRKQSLYPQVTNINDIVPGFCELARRAISEDIEIETKLDGKLWPALVDHGQLENALLNLVINARDAMPEGGHITIETENEPSSGRLSHDAGLAPGDYIAIKISDTGFGMTSDTIDHACEPFFTTKDVGEGSGLGLSMAFGFAKQSGGHLALSSEVGKGTTARIYLPRAEQAEEDLASPEQVTEELPKGSERIFVLEDDAEVREFVVEALGSLGYDVVEAEDGAAARSKLEKAGPIDMLLSDVVLPGGLSGPEFADEFRVRHPRAKVLFSSGYDRELLSHRGKFDQDVELLAKPYSISDVAHRIRALFDAGV